jgi:hypothetical protein
MGAGIYGRSSAHCKHQGLIREKVYRCYDAKLAYSKGQIKEVGENAETADQHEDLQTQPVQFLSLSYEDAKCSIKNKHVTRSNFPDNLVIVAQCYLLGGDLRPNQFVHGQVGLRIHGHKRSSPVTDDARLAYLCGTDHGKGGCGLIEK